jgi:hypothetical protein
LLWGWPRFAASVLLSFSALLRPFETLPLRRRDLLLPQDRFRGEVFRIYVRILKPKMRRKTARRAWVRVDDELVVLLVATIISTLPGEAQVYPGSAASYRSRWDRVLGALRVPVGDPQGLVPAACRGGGAIYLFEESDENTERVRWRGRWLDPNQLEIYLQEVGPKKIFLSELSTLSRSLVEVFEGLLPEVIDTVLRWLRQGVSPSLWFDLWHSGNRAQGLPMRQPYPPPVDAPFEDPLSGAQADMFGFDSE